MVPGPEPRRRELPAAAAPPCLCAWSGGCRPALCGCGREAEGGRCPSPRAPPPLTPAVRRARPAVPAPRALRPQHRSPAAPPPRRLPGRAGSRAPAGCAHPGGAGVGPAGAELGNPASARSGTPSDLFLFATTEAENTLESSLPEYRGTEDTWPRERNHIPLFGGTL